MTWHKKLLDKAESVTNNICAFWLLGGGIVISLFSLILSWKLALGILCVWLASLIATALWLVNQSMKGRS